MSLVWPETVDIYLSQRLAMVRSGRRAPIVMTYSPTLPLADVLERLGSAGFSGKSQRRRVCFTLGAALAPPIPYRVPDQVTRWSEKWQIARATAAQYLSMPPELVACQIDASGSGVAVALASSALDQLRSWGSPFGARVVSVQPLWSIAMQCKAVTAAAVDGLWVQEPDGACFVIGSGKPSAQLFAGVLVGQAHTVQPEINAKMRDADLTEAQMLGLGFDVIVKEIAPDMPKRWMQHWHRI